MATQPRLTSSRQGPGELTGRLTEAALGYQRMLKQNPCRPEALVGISLVALASGQFEAAVKMATAAVTAAPRMGNAWVALGQALKAAGRPGEAEHAYAQAIHLDGMNALARMGLGELKIATGHPEEAIREFELALIRQPYLVPAHMGLGHALAVMERKVEALQCYEKALALRPRLPEAEFAAGFVLSRLGKLKQAKARYRRALVLRPDFAAAWMNLGYLLREQGSEAYAEAALLRAVQLRPDLIAGWLNLALLERERRRPIEAAIYLSKAFELNPEQIETLVAWCQFRASERDLPGAWEWLGRAQARDPNHAEAMNMQGILLHAERRFAEAIEAFERAETLGSRPAASNRGNTLLDMGRMDEALKAHETAVERDPIHPGALYNLALTQMRLGDWERGWPAYEARWRFREVHRAPRVFSRPQWRARWRGEPLEGRTVLLHAEQGLGDTIQFCRYAALVAARGGDAILQVQAPVERLMRSLAAVRSGQVQTALLGARSGGEKHDTCLPSPAPIFDLECPLMSLPAVFHTAIDTVPWPGAYLGADPELASIKRARFPDIRSERWPLRVGLAWAGNPNYKADRQRSMTLETLIPLLRLPGIIWISLQKSPAAEQLSGLPQDIFIWDGSSLDSDLAETAALLSTLDLVVTTDTCIAHLAGAMAKPVWILLPHLSDWRWMQNVETTPWYPTARLLRQKVPGDWAGVLDRVIAGLRAFPRPQPHWEAPFRRRSAIVRAPVP